MELEAFLRLDAWVNHPNRLEALLMEVTVQRLRMRKPLLIKSEDAIS